MCLQAIRSRRVLSLLKRVEARELFKNIYFDEDIVSLRVAQRPVCQTWHHVEVYNVAFIVLHSCSGIGCVL